MRKLNNRRQLNLKTDGMDPEINSKSHHRFYDWFKAHLGTVIYYNPRFHEDDEPQLSDTEALITLVKCTLGTGILAMPRAYYNAGWLLGFMSTIPICSFLVYAMHVLLNDIGVTSKRYKITALTYSEAMHLAVSNGPNWIRRLNKFFARQVDAFLCIYHFGVDVVYVVFIAKNIKLLLDDYLPPIDTRIYIALITLPLILAFLVGSIKLLIPMAIIANILMLLGLGIIFSYLFSDLPSLAERTAIQNFSEYPLFFGTTIFALEAIGVVLQLQLHMRTPEHFLGTYGVLNRGMMMVTVLYATFGFLGYWKYGEDTSTFILNNLPDETLSKVCTGFFIVAIFFSYALQGYVTIEIIWRTYIMSKLMGSDTIWIEYLVRMAMVVASVLCAIAYPDFGLLLSLVGSFCLAQLGFIYPAIMNICVCYSKGYGRLNILLWRSLLFIVIGLCGGIAGTMVSVQAIREKYSSHILLFLSPFQSVQ